MILLTHSNKSADNSDDHSNKPSLKQKGDADGGDDDIGSKVSTRKRRCTTRPHRPTNNYTPGRKTKQTKENEMVVLY